jgi:hypothetical protein
MNKQGKKTLKMLDTASAILLQALNLRNEVRSFACDLEDEKQKDIVLSTITELLNLTNTLIDIVGEKELQEYNALLQSWKQGREK